MSGVVVGEGAVLRRVVEPQHTAHAFGNEGVHVLGTPALVGWLEDAAASTIEPALELQQQSVGTYVEVHHLAPAIVGTDVTVTAAVTAVDGRRIDFDVAAHSEQGQIALGRHQRVIVDSRRFP